MLRRPTSHHPYLVGCLFALLFFATAAAAAPTISTLTPTSGAVGAAVTIAGTNFGSTQGSSTVTFNGATATVTSWSAASIITQVPAGATTGNVVVRVSGVNSNGKSFTVLATPTMTSVSPTSGAIGASVTIAGSNFGATRGSSTVKFNATTVTSYTSWSATSLVVVVPSGATTGNVVVQAAGVDSNGQSFTVIPKPVVTGFSPTSATVGSSVTVSGTGFGVAQGSSTIKFNGTIAAPTSWNDTSIVAPVPNGATTGNVVVTTAGGASTGVSFTVIAAPTISSLSPTSGAVGASITINGTNFQPTQATGSAVVTLNGVVTTPTSWTSTQIKAPVPSGATSGNVVVTSFGLASNGKNFTVKPTPVITGLSPTVGEIGMIATIAGSGFGASQGTSTLKFNGTTATPSSWSDTQIVVPVPAGATTGTVIVHASGVDSAGVLFTVSTLTAITLTPASPSVPLHSQQRFIAVGTYASGGTQSLGSNATWSSSDTSIASVDANGLTTATAQGSATIQATRGALSGSAPLTVAPPVFITTGALHVPRVGHTATLLQDGRVLIVGGDNNEARTELYDPATGTFTLTGNLVNGRHFHGAVRLLDGRVLIFGGGFGGVTSAELYDPGTGTFSSTGSMAVSHNTGVLLDDGRVLVGLGDTTSEVYDPTTGAFTPTTPIPLRRALQSTTRLADGTVLLAGGLGGVSSIYENQFTADLYDVVTGTTVATGNLVQPRASHTGTLLNNGTVLLVGGGFGSSTASTTLASSEIYTPSTHTFASNGDLSVERGGHTATLLNDGSVLVVGGTSSTATTGTAELYDPSTQTFAAAGALTRPRSGHTATLLNDGTVLIVGGSINSILAEANSILAELYAPTLPTPYTLRVTPATSQMVVGESRQFSAVDNHGAPRTNATWTVSDDTLATLGAGGAPVLTAVAAGVVTITATVDGITAQATVTISADPLPVGTARWTVPLIPAFSPVQVAQAVPSADGPNLYSIQSKGPDSWVQAFASDGQQVWQTALPAVSATSVPDAYGGLIVTEHATCLPGQTEPMKIVSLDPATGDWRWDITSAPVWISPNSQIFCYEEPQMAVRGDGKIVIAGVGNTSGLPELMVVDGLTGSPQTIPIDISSYWDGTHFVAGYSPIGPPIVDANGNAWVAFEQRTIASGPQITYVALKLVKIELTGARTTITLAEETGVDENLFPGRIIPDGEGGVVVTWTVMPSSPPSPPPTPPVQPYRAVHVSIDGAIGTPYSLPFTSTTVTLGKNPTLILGPNASAIATNELDTDHGAQVAAFDLDTGVVSWTYQASTASTVHLMAATSDGGVTINDSVAGVVQLDAGGVPSTLSSSLESVAGYSWAGDWYLQGLDGVSAIELPVEIDAANEWATPGGSASQNGIGMSLCPCMSQATPEDPAARIVLPSVKRALLGPTTPVAPRTGGAGAVMEVTTSYTQMVGDPGINVPGCAITGHCHNVGHLFERVADTERANLIDLGYDVTFQRISTVEDFNDALTSHFTLSGGAIYYGHAAEGEVVGPPSGRFSLLAPGEAHTPNSNVSLLNVTTLSNSQLGPNATITLKGCKAGARPTRPILPVPGAELSIAQLIANQLQRTVYAWKVGLFFADDPNVSAVQQKTLANTLPMYFIPVGGTKVKPCAYTPGGAEPHHCGGEK